MDRQLVLEEMHRVLQSTGFVRSQRMSRFLRIIVERAIAGHGDRVNEYALGIEVFERRSDYDPRADPIVRVEARRLRSKLKQYYETAGRDSELCIDVPKGTYVPRFGPPDGPSHERVRGLAVLPISNRGDPEHQSLCEAFTQDIIHEIIKASGLRVVAWRSSATSGFHQFDISSIGRRLGVSHLVCGTLLIVGSRVRVLTHLIDTSNSEYVWSERYDGTLPDAFEIARHISHSLGVVVERRTWAIEADVQCRRT